LSNNQESSFKKYRMNWKRFTNRKRPGENKKADSAKG
jgi:hypothetical protein